MKKNKTSLGVIWPRRRVGCRCPINCEHSYSQLQEWIPFAHRVTHRLKHTHWLLLMFSCVSSPVCFRVHHPPAQRSPLSFLRVPKSKVPFSRLYSQSNIRMATQGTLPLGIASHGYFSQLWTPIKISFRPAVMFLGGWKMWTGWRKSS